MSGTVLADVETVQDIPEAMTLDIPGCTSRRLREAVHAIAVCRIPTVLVGEPGTGCEILARAIHVASGSTSPYTVIQCTGSAAGRWLVPGSTDSPFQHEGTVTLVEPGELPQAMQAALFEVLGPCAARILVCSHHDLEEECRKGRLREDLARLLGQLVIRVPALRQRREDIPPMMERLVQRYASVLQKPRPTLGSQLLKALQELPWTGNIPELDAMAKMIVLLGDERMSIATVRSLAREEYGNGPRITLKEAARSAARAAEREMIQKAMHRSGGNRKVAARQLDVSYKALLYKLKQFGIATANSRGNV